jgi:hypothetical protein
MPKLPLPIKSIKIDPAVLPRVKQDDSVVDDYEAILRLDPKAMEPPVVFFDSKANWLADGCRRLAAFRRIGVDSPVCDVRKGSRSEAVFYASGANREHGVRLTNAEKKQAVLNCLADPEVAKNVDATIAEQCGVGSTLVVTTRAKLAGETGEPAPTERVTKSGKVVTVGGGRKKKKGPKKKKKAAPGAPVFDAMNDEVPDWCREVFVDRVEIANYWNGLSANVIAPAERLAKLKGGKRIEPKAIAGWLNEIRKHVRDEMPHCVCPECKDAGKLRPSCSRCKGGGWLTKPQYEKNYLA